MRIGIAILLISLLMYVSVWGFGYLVSNTEQLNTELEQAHQRIQSLVAEIAQLRNQLSVVSQALQSERTEKEKLLAENQELRERLDALQAELSATRVELVGTQQENRYLHDRARELTNVSSDSAAKYCEPQPEELSDPVQTVRQALPFLLIGIASLLPITLVVAAPKVFPSLGLKRQLKALARSAPTRPPVQFCGITQHVIMSSCFAKLPKYFANSRAKHVADLRSEILEHTASPNCSTVLIRMTRRQLREHIRRQRRMPQS